MPKIGARSGPGSSIAGQMQPHPPPIASQPDPPPPHPPGGKPGARSLILDPLSRCFSFSCSEFFPIFFVVFGTLSMVVEVEVGVLCMLDREIVLFGGF
jgi:hypothetical protein